MLHISGDLMLRGTDVKGGGVGGRIRNTRRKTASGRLCEQVSRQERMYIPRQNDTPGLDDLSQQL